MGKTTIRELTGGKVTLKDLDFFPCVRSGMYLEETEKKKRAYGFGIGLVEYLNENAKGKINCSYTEGEFGYLKFKSKHGNEILIEIAGGSLNELGDYLHVTNKTKKKEKWIRLAEKCEELAREDYEQALHICIGRKRWK